MKIVISIILLLFLNTQYGLSQKEDYFWMFGYSSDTTTMEFGGTNIDFNIEPPDIYYEFRDMNFDIANSSICDSIGNLLFYTNGIAISNVDGEIMENGDGLNPDSFREDWVEIGYPLYQGTLVLPLPNNPQFYFLFHEEYSYAPDDPAHLTKIYTLYYTLIDMSVNNGLGKVIEKNVPVIQDTLDYGKITATKHANGVDWWIVVPKFDSNSYYRILFTEEGISTVESQDIGEMVYAGAGQAVFSPDGSKYVRYVLKNINVGNFLNIYDFDRCTGLLSDPNQYNIIDTAYSGGVAISPNSRYLYVSSFIYTYQFDLEADDINASKDTVAIFDGYLAPFLPSTFFLAQLAPDDKIYVNSHSSVNVLHVIHHPDEAGEACNFEQHSIQLPTYNAFSMPNFPNYRLGALPDSCETVGTNTLEPLSKHHVKVYPNPTTEKLHISANGDFQNRTYTLSIYNILGEQLYLQQDFSLSEAVDVSQFFAGTYFLQLQSGEGRITRKFVVQR